MLKIDAHQHFWQYDPVRDSWISHDMAVLRKDYLPEDLLPHLQANSMDGCVLVQSTQTNEENIFHLENAAKHDFIKGVVGWVDLQSPKLQGQLEYYRSFSKLKGFREILQGNDKLLQSASFKEGLALLKKYGFTYDLLVFSDQLQAATALVKSFPDQQFVLNHLGKPAIRKGEIVQWKKNIREMAACPNIHCKISGMVTEADTQNRSMAHLVPYMDVVVEAFGTKRIMFGSDWPVCLMAATYAETVDIAGTYFSSFTKKEQELFWGLNAQSFYQLN